MISIKGDTDLRACPACRAFPNEPRCPLCSKCAHVPIGLCMLDKFHELAVAAGSDEAEHMRTAVIHPAAVEMIKLADEDPQPFETMTIRIELYEKFSLAMLDERPGSCGTGDTPVLAIKDLFDFLLHEYETLLQTPEEQCDGGLNAMREPMRKFHNGMYAGRSRP